MPYQLIIIDDEKEISSGFAQFFPWSQLGFVVIAQFTRAVDALEFLKSNETDVIVTDVLMPGMTGIELAKELTSMELNPHPLIVFFSAYDKFQYAQQALEYGGYQYILKSTGYDELIGVFTRLRERLDNSRVKTETQDRIIATIKRYVEEHPCDATLEAAAERVYLSHSYVSKYFKQKTGQNFADYLMEQRMHRAAALLTDLQYKIYDISTMIGYANPFNFSRSFKKFYGMTPKEYRMHKLGRVLSDDGE